MNFQEDLRWNDMITETRQITATSTTNLDDTDGDGIVDFRYG
jgi:hypothetical protein